MNEQFKRLIAGDEIPSGIDTHNEAATSLIWDTRVKNDKILVAAFTTDVSKEKSKTIKPKIMILRNK